jgi:hypothetical protein
VLATTTVVFASLWLVSIRDDDGGSRSAAEAAGRFTERFLTIDSTKIERTQDAVLELSTGAFRRTYRTGLASGVLQVLLTGSRVRTEATVTEVFIGETDARTAHVITDVRVTVRPLDTGRAVRQESFLVELDLVKQRGKWLVDNVADLRPGGTAEPAAGPGTTSSSAPPAP